eukprot:COSAG02_NODE_524_length_20723_cov_79.399438_8_plen_68_part_00
MCVCGVCGLAGGSKAPARVKTLAVSIVPSRVIILAPDLNEEVTSTVVVSTGTQPQEAVKLEREHGTQ